MACRAADGNVFDQGFSPFFLERKTGSSLSEGLMRVLVTITCFLLFLSDLPGWSATCAPRGYLSYPTSVPSASLSGAASRRPSPCCFFHINRPMTCCLHQINKLLGFPCLRCPLNVLRVASLEVLPWHGLKCSARELNRNFNIYSSGFFLAFIFINFFLIGFTQVDEYQSSVAPFPSPHSRGYLLLVTAQEFSSNSG